MIRSLMILRRILIFVRTVPASLVFDGLAFLTRAFDAKSIAHEIPIIGASGKEWHVDAGITIDGKVRKLFESVSPRSASVAAAVMKFTDIRALENPPSVAVLSDRVRTEAALVLLLSRVAGAAIDATSEPEVYKSAA